MYCIKKDWKEFKISLPKLEEVLKAQFPANEEEKPVYQACQAYGDAADEDGVVIPGKIELYFNIPLEGYSKDEENNVITEAGSSAEKLEELWDSISAESIVATEYVNSQDLIDAQARAKEDACTKSWDALTVEQKKMISGVSISLDEQKQLLVDFPA